MAKRRRPTIAHNPLDDVTAGASAAGFVDEPERPRARAGRRQGDGARPAAKVEAAAAAPEAASDGGSCWMWWVGAGLVALVILV